MKDLQDLINVFNEAVYHEEYYIGVAVKLPNLEKPEIIINPQENFEEKLTYYKNAYNDDLTLKTCKDIKIVGASSGDFIDQVAVELALDVAE